MRLRTTTVLLLITFAVCGVHAQDSWSAHTRAGEYAFARGDLERAEAEFQAALEIAQQLPAGDRRLETSLENLARLSEHESDFDRAQSLYQLQLAAEEMRVGEEDPVLLDTLLAVARAAQPSGDVPTVQESLTRYTQIAETTGKADPGRWWRALAILARTETIQEHHESALRWQRRAVEVLDDDRGATETERADAIETLARMELVAGEGRRAEMLLVKVAQLRTAEDEADATADTMASGAAVAFGAGEPVTAERLAMRALNAAPNAEAELMARRVLADISWVRVGRGTDDLAVLLAAATEDEELVRARDRLRSLNVLENGENRETLTRLVQVEALRGHPGEAARWQQQVLALALADGNALAARQDLVTLLAAAGELDEALAENAAILADLEAQHGAADPRLLPVLEQRLELLIRAGHKKEAKKVRKRVKKLAR